MLIASALNGFGVGDGEDCISVAPFFDGRTFMFAKAMSSVV
jgi:hypothetical protein